MDFTPLRGLPTRRQAGYGRLMTRRFLNRNGLNNRNHNCGYTVRARRNGDQA
jgi:hypothetical protein